MNKSDIDNYHKFHRMTISYGEAEKYIQVGWKLMSVYKFFLKGINKEYEQCCLLWDKDDTPIDPS